MRPTRQLTALATATIAAATLGGISVTSGPATAAEAASSSTFPMADPDTLRDGNTYYTYGTTIGATSGKRCGAPTGKKLHVPVLKHGSGNTVGMSDCAVADALPNGPGSWADGTAGLWAPGVTKWDGKYWLYYTAKKAGSGQRCIGKAVASSPTGPFANKGEFACPPKGRWAIDANPYVAGGRMYVTYRDDAVNSFPQTGISTVKVDANGAGIWTTRKTLLTSTDIGWESIRMSGSTHVVENPTMFYYDGEWWLAFSGNNWNSRRYATGLAACGTSPLPSGKCTLVRRGAERPYFGFNGTGDLNPYHGMPGNKTGPGALDIYTAPDGTSRATWHWYNETTKRRYPITATLSRTTDGFWIK